MTRVREAGTRAPVPRTIGADPRRLRRKTSPVRVQSCSGGSSDPPKGQSLLDVVDNLIDKGLALDTELVLGLADIDLIYLRAGALLAAADRVFPTGRRNRRSARAPSGTRSLNHSMPPAARPVRVSAVPIQSNVGSAVPGPVATAPHDASRSVIRLVLTLVEFVRQLLERQAVRRVRERTLTSEEIERLGTALMTLEATVQELAERHGLDAADLNLDLGPLGTLR